MLILQSVLIYIYLCTAYAASSPEPGNADERGSNYQGDIVLPPVVNLKGGLIGDELKWPGGSVFYQIDELFSEEERNMTLRSLSHISENTSINFLERTSEVDYVFIQRGLPDSGCSSALGKQGGEQVINLEQPICVKFGLIIHEMMHTLGFLHEHTRPDRDAYITIDFDNIQPGAEGEFAIQPQSTYNISYDYGSIMHFSRFAFAANPNVTTIETVEPNAIIGQRYSLSPADIAAINAMYCTAN